MPPVKFESVDDYIASQPKASQPVLERVRSAIRRAVPEAEEVISYHIPTYKLQRGTRAMVVYFAGWKNHYSVYPATGRVVEVLGKELAAYDLEKGTIRFPLAEPVPVKLIAKIAKLRAQEALAPRARKPAKTSKTAARKPATRKPLRKPRRSARA